MKIKVKLLENTTQVQKLIVRELRKDIFRLLSSAALSIEKQARYLVRAAIVRQPEYVSLLEGSLNYEFGLTNAESKIDTLLKIWTNSIIVDIKNPVGDRSLKSVITLNMINADFSDVLNVPEAFQQTEKGSSLHWLYWLLINGDKAIVRDYEVVITNDKSRTGVAVMRRRNGRSWSVPPEFSGTVKNNWITRALNGLDDTIEQLISDELQRIWQ